jgi:2'-5' RNA ligase
MRLFLGIPLEDALRAELGKRLRGFAKEFPACRWVPVENLHVTLRFLGEVEEAEVAEVRDWCDAQLADAQFSELRLGRHGWFERRERWVFWVGLEQAEWIQAVAARLAGPVASVQAEEREFAAHLTIARWTPKPRERRDASALRDRCVELPPLNLVQSRTRVVLFRSQLSPGGAVYHELASWPDL